MVGRLEHWLQPRRGRAPWSDLNHTIRTVTSTQLSHNLPLLLNATAEIIHYVLFSSCEDVLHNRAIIIIWSRWNVSFRPKNQRTQLQSPYQSKRVTGLSRHELRGSSNLHCYVQNRAQLLGLISKNRRICIFINFNYSLQNVILPYLFFINTTDIRIIAFFIYLCSTFCILGIHFAMVNPNYLPPSTTSE